MKFEEMTAETVEKVEIVNQMKDMAERVKNLIDDMTANLNAGAKELNFYAEQIQRQADVIHESAGGNVYQDLFMKQTRINDINRDRWKAEIETKDKEIEALNKRIEELKSDLKARSAANFAPCGENPADLMTNSPEVKIAFMSGISTLKRINDNLAVLYGKLPMEEMDECFAAWHETVSAIFEE